MDFARSQSAASREALSLVTDLQQRFVAGLQAAQQSLAAGMLATPAAIVTIKTVGPAFAALKDSGLQ